MIFALPFHTQRFFRATLLDAFEISNTQLGDMFAVYGITAMFSYILGGPFADRYSARSLMAVSLVSTAVGGLYMATFPGVLEMSALYGFWGISSTFLFWAALIKATRDWGGNRTQGIAFGILDGGRGFAAAAFGAMAVAILALYLPAETALVTNTDRQAGLRSIILFYSLITLVCAALVWFLVPHDESTVTAARNPFRRVPEVIRRPLIWAQAGIIIAAYCGYKALDNYQLYGVQVLGLNEIDAARLTTYGAYLRPVAAVMAGIIADRFESARSILVMFIMLALSFGMLSMATTETSSMSVLYGNLFVTFFAVYALRGIYYALLQETRTPTNLTGAAVAIISFIGYTPEIFFGPVTGRILDASPGAPGHLHFFAFLAAMSAGGILVSMLLIRLNRRQSTAAAAADSAPG